MTQMSSQLTREFWTYLHDQVELHQEAYFQTIYDPEYKAEMKATAEMYDWLAKEFSLCFATATSTIGGIDGGLTAQETSQFLQLLDQKIQHFIFAGEQIQRQKQEALAQAHEWEYHGLRRAYQAMENLTERETTVYRNSRERFLNMLEER
jgi:hypothetical protein